MVSYHLAECFKRARLGSANGDSDPIFAKWNTMKDGTLKYLNSKPFKRDHYCFSHARIILDNTEIQVDDLNFMLELEENVRECGAVISESLR